MLFNEYDPFREKLNPEEYDLGTMDKYLDSLFQIIMRIVPPFNMDIRLASRVGSSWVTPCTGDHDECGHNSIHHPTMLECDLRIRDTETYNRIKRLRRALEDFKRTPEQLEYYKREQRRITQEKADKKRAIEYERFCWNI